MRILHSGELPKECRLSLLKDADPSDMCLCLIQYYAFVEEKQKVHCLNTLFAKVISALPVSRITNLQPWARIRSTSYACLSSALCEAIYATA